MPEAPLEASETAPLALPLDTILCGDALSLLRTLPSESAYEDAVRDVSGEREEAL